MSLNRLRKWLNSTVESKIQELSQVVNEGNQALKLLVQNNVELSNKLIEIGHKESALLSAGLAARAVRLAGMLHNDKYRPIAVKPLSFEKALKQMKDLNPRIFPIWLRLYENGARSYVEERLGSCSHREHHFALLFGAYCEIYGHGHILDIGCGPYGIPSYLATRDPNLISGLEPLELKEEPEFLVARGFNEFLPWEDGQFDTVVSATSLDHVLSLKVSLAEVCRVLRDGGRYIVWLASIPGAKPFDESASNFIAIDAFHLFHFDRPWIEPIFEEFFEIEDITIISQIGFDHVFYCMKPKRRFSRGNSV
jgi:SAM-dependent methyltransferase